MDIEELKKCPSCGSTPEFWDAGLDCVGGCVNQKCEKSYNVGLNRTIEEAMAKWQNGEINAYEGPRLSEIRDYESSHQFDAWWSSVPKTTMLEYGEQGLIQEKFDEWRAARTTKH